MCKTKIPNYAVKAIVLTFSFNFKEFLSEDLQVQIFFKLLSFNITYSSKGFPESVVAAALSKEGLKVLHLDR